MILLALSAGSTLCLLFGIAILRERPFGSGPLFGDPALERSRAFLGALEDGDYPAAYDMCSPALQKSLADAAGLQRAIEAAGARPKAWQIGGHDIGASEAVVSGTLVTARAGTFKLSLSRLDRGWRVDAFDFSFE